MTPTAYKCYIFNGTDTYTDISDKVINDVQIPVLVMNPDQSPVLQGIQLETALDYRSTTLIDGTYICLEIGTVKKWYGYIESSYYDYSSNTYFYEVFNIFEGLKDVTCYTDLAANVHLATFNSRVAFDNLSNIKNGTDDIDWNDLTLKELIEHIMESSDYSGLTHVVTWSLGVNMTTILENFCVSSLCIKNLGTDYSDEELTGVTADPDIAVWDLLLLLFKMLGLRYYYTAELAITIKGTDTAPAKTDYMGAGDPYYLGKWINRYSYQVKKVKEKKKFVIKQNILNITDYPVSEDIVHRYFSPTIFGIPYLSFNNAEQDGDDVLVTIGDINGTHNHKLPATDNTMFKTLTFVNQLDTDFEIAEEWDYEDATDIRIYDRSLEEFRHLRTNLAVDDTYNIDAATTHFYRIYIDLYPVKIDITFDKNHDLLADQHTLQIRGNDENVSRFNYNYTYAASGTAAGTYVITDVDKVTCYRNDLTISAAYNYTDAGTVYEITGGTPGDPQYIIKTAKHTLSGVNVIIIYCQAHGVVTTDVINIFGTEEIDGRYTEQTTLTSLATGQYYIASANQLYILDEDQALEEYGYLKVSMPKYQNYVNLTDGKEDQNINLTDYLVIYRPPDWSAMAAGWRKDWFAIDMEDATNCLLLNFASYAPWWYYTYNQAYQTITSESINLDDTVAPIMTTARRIIYNVRNHSIDLEQDSV